MANIIRKKIAFAVLALAAQPVLAQIERYDAGSGKYVTSDPFAQPASPPSPYRLNPRISRNGSVAQQVPSIAVPGAAASVPAPAAADTSSQFAPLGGMAMYGSDAGSGDPFAKPDWWPH